MHKDIIRRLTQLNTNFYQTVSSNFSDTRQHSWPGWDKIAPFIEAHLLTKHPSEEISICDMACGNARFCTFVSQTWPNLTFTYTGIDNNQNLLEIARHTAKMYGENTLQLSQQNIVNNLINQSTDYVVAPGTQHLTVAFGIFHHIPSLKLRRELLNQLISLTLPDGMIIFTTWQFLDSPRLVRKIISASQAGFDPADLEPNDYFLDWQRGPTAIRYCHYIDDNELENLLKNQPVTPVTAFKADGKEGYINRYVVLKKIA